MGNLTDDLNKIANDPTKQRKKEVKVKDEKGVVRSYFTDSSEYKKIYDTGRLVGIDKDGTINAVQSPAVEVTAEAPAWLKQARYLASENGNRNAYRKMGANIANPFFEGAKTVAEFTGIPGAVRFVKDPVKSLTGVANTLEDIILDSNTMPQNIIAPSEYKSEDVEGLFNTLDAVGISSALFKNPIQQAIKQTGKYFSKGSLNNAYRINIPNQYISSNNAYNLEKLRNAYHNSTRFLMPDEISFLHKHGHGKASQYRNAVMRNLDSYDNLNQLPPPPSEIYIPSTQNTYTNNFTFRNEDIISSTPQNIPTNSINLQRNREVTQWTEQRLNSYKNRLNELDAQYQDIISNPSQYGDYYNEFLRRNIDLTRRFEQAIQEGQQNLISRGIISPKTSAIKPKTLNKSGLTKDEVLEKAAAKDKDVISKMSDDEFQNTVLKPTGEIAPYQAGKTAEGVVDASKSEYVDEFNKNLDDLNENIINGPEGLNESGVKYEIKGLTEGGTLTVYTPKQTLADGRVIEEGTQELYMPIRKAGFWRGEVEDVASHDYINSIPGLKAYNTSGGIFADMSLKGIPKTRFYESLNTYMKKYDLGRLSDGASGQSRTRIHPLTGETQTGSFEVWENIIKKNKAVGFYSDPRRQVTGIFRSLLPYAGTGYLGYEGLKNKTKSKYGSKVNNNENTIDPPKKKYVSKTQGTRLDDGTYVTPIAEVKGYKTPANAVREGRGKFAKGLYSGANLATEVMGTPLALTLETLSGRGDYKSALPNVDRSNKMFGLPYDKNNLPQNEQLSPSTALGIDNPYMSVPIDLATDLLTGKLATSGKSIGKNLIKNKIPKQLQSVNQAGFLDLFGLGKPKQAFQSEIDWGKWNKEIPENKALMQEYNVTNNSSGNNIDFVYNNKEGNIIATFKGQKNGDKIYVNGIEVNPEYRRKGVASKVYQDVNKYANKNNMELHSRTSQHQFTDTDELGRSIAPATKLWDNLVNKGLAERYKDGMMWSYKMKPAIGNNGLLGNQMTQIKPKSKYGSKVDKLYKK